MTTGPFIALVFSFTVCSVGPSVAAHASQGSIAGGDETVGPECAVSDANSPNFKHDRA